MKVESREPPPPYPRVPHLVARPGMTTDDRVLSRSECAGLLQGPVSVEEKLDGANVAIWSDEGVVRVQGRRAGSTDRGNQLGRLRAWLAANLPFLGEQLGERAVYCEWLWRRHSVPYNSLPSYLVGLDLLGADGVWAPESERRRALLALGMTAPPLLTQGEVLSLADLDRLQTKSRVGQRSMEGLIVRPENPGDGARVAKLLGPGFRIRSDEDWLREGDQVNALR